MSHHTHLLTGILAVLLVWPRDACRCRRRAHDQVLHLQDNSPAASSIWSSMTRPAGRGQGTAPSHRVLLRRRLGYGRMTQFVRQAEHLARRGMVGGKFDPEKFSVEAVNKELRKV